MVCWLLLLLSFCTSLLLVVKFVSGAGGGRFPNGAFGSANAGCSGVAEFGHSCLERVVVIALAPEILLMSRRA